VLRNYEKRNVELKKYNQSVGGIEVEESR